MTKATKVIIQNNDKNKTKSKKLPPKKRDKNEHLVEAQITLLSAQTQKSEIEMSGRQKGDKNERIRTPTNTK